MIKTGYEFLESVEVDIKVDINNWLKSKNDRFIDAPSQYSPYEGVEWWSRFGKFAAFLENEDEYILLGTFDTCDEANDLRIKTLEEVNKLGGIDNYIFSNKKVLTYGKVSEIDEKMKDDLKEKHL